MTAVEDVAGPSGDLGGVELGVGGEASAQRIVKVRGDGDNPRSQGYLCNKAQSIPSYVHHRDRLTTPLRRRADGRHEPIDWDTAVREIAERRAAPGSPPDTISRRGGSNRRRTAKGASVKASKGASASASSAQSSENYSDLDFDECEEKIARLKDRLARLRKRRAVFVSDDEGEEEDGGVFHSDAQRTPGPEACNREVILVF